MVRIVVGTIAAAEDSVGTPLQVLRIGTGRQHVAIAVNVFMHLTDDIKAIDIAGGTDTTSKVFLFKNPTA